MDSKTCICCWETKQKNQLISLSESIKCLISKHFAPELDLDMRKLSTKICKTCKTQLYNMDKGRPVKDFWQKKIQKVS